MTSKRRPAPVLILNVDGEETAARLALVGHDGDGDSAIEAAEQLFRDEYGCERFGGALFDVLVDPRSQAPERGRPSDSEPAKRLYSERKCLYPDCPHIAVQVSHTDTGTIGLCHVHAV